MAQRFPVGTEFIKRGDKQKRVNTVVDFITATNLNGEIVKEYYVAEHEFLGQTIREVGIVDTTIALGLVNNKIEDFL